MINTILAVVIGVLIVKLLIWIAKFSVVCSLYLLTKKLKARALKKQDEARGETKGWM